MGFSEKWSRTKGSMNKTDKEFKKWCAEQDADHMAVLCDIIAYNRGLLRRTKDKEIKDNALLIIYMAQKEMEGLE